MENIMLERIFKDGILVDVNIRAWTGSLALTPSDLGLKETEVATAYHLGRKFLIPEEVIREFKTLDGRARHAVERASFPFPIGATRFMPRVRFEKVEEELLEIRRDYMAQVDSLIEHYEEYKAKMIPVYQQASEQAWSKQQSAGVQTQSPEELEKAKTEYLETFMTKIRAAYPTADYLRGCYSLTWDVFKVAPSEEDAKYNQQIKDKMESFIGDVVTSLRQETIDLCTKISTNIAGGKVVRGKTLNSIKNFIERFKSLNFIGDATIETQLESLKKEFLDVHTSESMETAEVQVELQRRLKDLANVAGSFNDVSAITGLYKRKVRLDLGVTGPVA